MWHHHRTVKDRPPPSPLYIHCHPIIATWKWDGNHNRRHHCLCHNLHHHHQPKLTRNDHSWPNDVRIPQPTRHRTRYRMISAPKCYNRWLHPRRYQPLLPQCHHKSQRIVTPLRLQKRHVRNMEPNRVPKHRPSYAWGDPKRRSNNGGDTRVKVRPGRRRHHQHTYRRNRDIIIIILDFL